jgi:hypothetical protein
MSRVGAVAQCPLLFGRSRSRVEPSAGGSASKCNDLTQLPLRSTRLAVYRFIKSNTPATIASTANKSPLYAKLNFRKGAVNIPNKMSQTANRIIPKLFGALVKKFITTA